MTRAASMLVLALDTTTRAGSLALARDDRLLEVWSGDPGLTHASRLPGDILDILRRQGLALADVDLYGVAAGPGSFTGLRIGIATIQGLAFAHGRKVVGVSALDALAWSAAERLAAPPSLVAAWMDARRGEVFASLGTPAEPAALSGPEVASPAEVLGRWEPLVGDRPVAWLGDGTVAYHSLIEQGARGRAWTVLPEVPLLAAAVAAIARRRAADGQATPPHGVRPLYVRRPDAELARDRKHAATGGGEAGHREDGP